MWCRDEEGWGSRDFNLFTLVCDNCGHTYNYEGKPGLVSCRLDGGHGGGNCVDASDDSLKGNDCCNDKRKFGRAVGIFVR